MAGESIDTDIDVTEMRWKNHIEGKIKFDEDNNTIRGIEVGEAALSSMSFIYKFVDII